MASCATRARIPTRWNALSSTRWRLRLCRLVFPAYNKFLRLAANEHRLEDKTIHLNRCASESTIKRGDATMAEAKKIAPRLNFQLAPFGRGSVRGL